MEAFKRGEITTLEYILLLRDYYLLLDCVFMQSCISHPFPWLLYFSKMAAKTPPTPLVLQHDLAIPHGGKKVVRLQSLPLESQ